MAPIYAECGGCERTIALPERRRTEAPRCTYCGTELLLPWDDDEAPAAPEPAMDMAPSVVRCRICARRHRVRGPRPIYIHCEMCGAYIGLPPEGEDGLSPPRRADRGPRVTVGLPCGGTAGLPGDTTAGPLDCPACDGVHDMTEWDPWSSADSDRADAPASPTDAGVCTGMKLITALWRAGTTDLRPVVAAVRDLHRAQEWLDRGRIPEVSPLPPEVTAGLAAGFVLRDMEVTRSTSRRRVSLQVHPARSMDAEGRMLEDLAWRLAEAYFASTDEPGLRGVGRLLRPFQASDELPSFWLHMEGSKTGGTMLAVELQSPSGKRADLDAEPFTDDLVDALRDGMAGPAWAWPAFCAIWGGGVAPLMYEGAHRGLLAARIASMAPDLAARAPDLADAVLDAHRAPSAPAPDTDAGAGD